MTHSLLAPMMNTTAAGVWIVFVAAMGAILAAIQHGILRPYAKVKRPLLRDTDLQALAPRTNPTERIIDQRRVNRHAELMLVETGDTIKLLVEINGEMRVLHAMSRTRAEQKQARAFFLAGDRLDAAHTDSRID